MVSKSVLVVMIVMAVVVVLLLALTMLPQDEEPAPTRLETIPETAVKMTPEMDLHPPVSLSSEYENPVPMFGPINTAGAEDSAFVSSDGLNFYFFFTPDVSVPPEKQLLDKVTGIWWSKKVMGEWTEPERVILSDDLALDGAEFVQGNTMWFGSVREGNYGEVDVYTAELVDGKWANVENAGEQLNVDYDIGEFHITADWSTLYFHSGSWSPEGSMDLWMSNKTETGWDTPHEVPGLNTDANEGYPYISQDGNELWFTSSSRSGYAGPAIFKSERQGEGWSAPVEMFSNFAGECTIDLLGNVYFTHHFFDRNGTMLEADIYVAYQKTLLRTDITEDPALDGNLSNVPSPFEVELILWREE